MNIAFSGGTTEQRKLVQEAVAAVSDRHLDLSKFGHTWNIQFLAVGSIDTTPHDAFQTFMITQNDGTTQIRDDMPFKGQGPFAGVQFFQESVVHELGHHLLGNGPGQGFIGPDNQSAIAALFKATSSDWNPQNKTWLDRPVEGIAETFKDSFLAARRRVYSNRTNEKLPIHEYPDFRSKWTAAHKTAMPSHIGGAVSTGNATYEQFLAAAGITQPVHPADESAWYGDNTLLTYDYYAWYEAFPYSSPPTDFGGFDSIGVEVTYGSTPSRPHQSFLHAIENGAGGLGWVLDFFDFLFLSHQEYYPFTGEALSEFMLYPIWGMEGGALQAGAPVLFQDDVATYTLPDGFAAFPDFELHSGTLLPDGEVRYDVGVSFPVPPGALSLQGWLQGARYSREVIEWSLDPPERLYTFTVADAAAGLTFPYTPMGSFDLNVIGRTIALPPLAPAVGQISADGALSGVIPARHPIGG